MDMLDKFYNLKKNFSTFVISAHNPSDLDLADQIATSVRTKGGVFLADHLLLPIWKKLCELSEKFKPTDLILIEQSVPKDWPKLRSGKLIAYAEFLAKWAKIFVEHGEKNPHYNHGVNGLARDFYIPYGSFQYEREKLFRAIESFGLTSNSLYSRPPSQHDIVPLFGLQDPQPVIEPTRIEEKAYSTSIEKRYFHAKNFECLRPFMIQCHCAVVLDDFCFNDDYSGVVTEKVLYPVTAGIPWIYAGNVHQRQRLTELGFRDHLPLAVNGNQLINQMLWLQAVFKNPYMARRWQQQQGEIIIHNKNTLKKLRNKVDLEAQF